MKDGWFVGDFEPTALRTASCEVACKRYRRGERQDRHVHRVAVEATLILGGRARMAGRVCDPGDVIVLDPGEATDFEALDDLMTVVVKIPSVKNDKFPT